MIATKQLHRVATTAVLAGLSGAASAHAGHGAHELWDVLTHAFGVEQLLVLAAVVAGAAGLRWWRAGRGDRHPK